MQLLGAAYLGHIDFFGRPQHLLDTLKTLGNGVVHSLRYIRCQTKHIFANKPMLQVLPLPSQRCICCCCFFEQDLTDAFQNFRRPRKPASTPLCLQHIACLTTP